MNEPVQNTSRQRQPRSWGRRIGLGVYWILLLGISGTGLVSIVYQVFWPVHDGSQAADTCRGSIENLKHQLIERAQEQVGGAQEPLSSADAPAWMQRWDNLYLSLADQCGDHFTDARHHLLHLRYRIEAALTVFERSAAGLAKAVDRDLQAERTQ